MNIKSKTLKILMVQTANMNLGDTILADNDYFLLQKAVFPRKCDILRYSISSRDIGQIKYVDAVVFAGGIIKATNENFWLYIPELIQEAQKQNVPVFLSAIGVEAFYPDDERSVALKEALNLPCVKGISVRDDIETLKRDYITNPDICISSVYDPAIWCRDTYRKYLTGRKAKGTVVGLGIVREKLFPDYGHPEIDRQYQLDFWKGVAEALDAQNIPWKVFTNGDTYDELFAKEVLAYIGHGEKLPAPRDGVQLVQDISGFSGIIAGRMHSNIVAYSLGIPSVGFIWNRKLKFWGEKIGHPERFLPCDQMTWQNAVNALMKGMQEHSEPSEAQRNTVYLAIKDFVKQWCHVREKKTETLPFQSAMLAPALGGIDIRYRNTNSPEAFQYSLAHGYCNFQLDLRLTSDQVLVCVNRWHKDTYKIMNHPLKEEASPGPLSYREFLSCQYYNRFGTMDFDAFLTLAVNEMKKSNLQVVLAVGRPSAAEFETILQLLKESMEKHHIKQDRFFIRLEQKRDVARFWQSDLKMQVIYHMVDPKDSPEEALALCRASLEYCKSQKITYLSMHHDLLTDEMFALCREYPIRICTFTCVQTEKIIRNIQRGATFVGSHYYDVEYLKRLTR